MLRLFLLLIPILVHADPIRIDGEFDPSAYVHGCVNAITGAYVESSLDLSVQGPEPLTFGRNYSSEGSRDHLFGEGFSTTHPRRLSIVRIAHKGYFLDYEESGGSTIRMAAKRHATRPTFYLDADVIKKGLCNTSQGSISGQNSFKNLSVELAKRSDNPDKYWSLQASYGSGLSRYYEGNSLLLYERRPNGNHLHYRYDSRYRFQQIFTSGKIWDVIEDIPKERIDPLKRTSLNFSYSDDKTEILASNGKKATYTFFTKGGNKYLEEAKVSEQPTIRYAYDYKKNRMVARKLPQNRELHLKYDAKGRIKQLCAPVGTCQTPVNLYRFDYRTDQRYTDVTNTASQLKRFHYTGQRRLHQLDFFNEAETPYVSQKFFWGRFAGDQPRGKPMVGIAGDLTGKAILDASGQVVSAVSYTYDGHGNITGEIASGVLTGDVTDINIELDECGQITGGFHEAYGKSFSYSEDGLNLKTEERADDGSCIQYLYYPGTNLLYAKLTRGPCNVFQEREFFFYNYESVLIRTIRDNGHTADHNDLAPCPQRFITEYKIGEESANLGLPYEEKHLAYNPSTGQNDQIQRLVHSYDSFGRIVQTLVFDENDICQQWLDKAYDDLGNLIYETNPLGQATTYRYDGNKNKVFESLEGSGVYTTFKYDFQNNLIEKTAMRDDGPDLTESWTYDVAGQCSSYTNAYGHVTTYTYDGLGRQTTATLPTTFDEFDNPVLNLQTKEYDIYSNVTKSCLGTAPKLQATYNSRGQPLTQKNESQVQKTLRYHPNGLLRSTSTDGGPTHVFTYDVKGRKTAEVVYDSTGQHAYSLRFSYHGLYLAEETHKDGTRTTYSYDHKGRKTHQIHHTDDGVKTTLFTYDSMGRLHNTTHWYGSDYDAYRTSAKEYDALDRVIEEWEADAYGRLLSKNAYVYDINGNVVRTDTYSDETTYTTTLASYDSYGHLTSSTDALGNQTLYRYDTAFVNRYGQRVFKKETYDPNGNITIEVQDPLGRTDFVERKNSYEEQTRLTYYSYDAESRKTCEKHEIFYQGHTQDSYLIHYGYNPGEHKPCTQIQTGPDGVPRIHTFAYDSASRLIAVQNPNGSRVKYSYDALGRKKSVESESSRLSSQRIHYTFDYDANNNIISAYDHVNQRHTHRHYNPFNELTEETLDNGLTLQYQYDLIGRLTRVQFPDQSYTLYTYDAADLLSVSRYNPQNTHLYTHTYNETNLLGQTLKATLIDGSSLSQTFDSLGHLTSLNTDHYAISSTHYDRAGNLTHYTFNDLQGNGSQNYTYDPLDQLTAESGSISSSYTYDSLGNRHSRDGIAYQLSGPNDLLASHDATFTHDENGNPLSQTKAGVHTIYEYDALDRLIAVTTNKERTQYHYDPFNRRTELQRLRLNAAATEYDSAHFDHFLYQGLTEIGRYSADHQPQELKIQGKSQRGALGRAVAIELKTHAYAPIHDLRGNLCHLTDSHTGDPIECYRYSAFGEHAIWANGKSQSDSTVGNPYLFSEKRLDQETGFFAYAMRYYNPSCGRWLTPDPAGFNDGPNLYAFVHNNPLIAYDLWGLSTSNYSSSSQSSFFSRLPSPFRNPSRSSRSRLWCSPYQTWNHHYIAEKTSTRVERLTQGVVGDKDLPHGLVTLTGGIGTEPDKWVQEASRVSEMLGGYKVHWLLVPTNGIGKDLWGCVKNTFHNHTPGSKQVSYFLKNTCRAGLDRDPMFTLYAIGHSRGGLMNKLALDDFTPEMKRATVAFTLGSPESIRQTGMKGAYNYANKYDMVSANFNSEHPPVHPGAPPVHDVHYEVVDPGNGHTTRNLEDHYFKSYFITLDAIADTIIRKERLKQTIMK